MVVFCCFPFDESHEGLAFQEMISAIVEEYELFQKIHLVVRDNAVAAVNSSPFNHIGCFFHISQLVVFHAVFNQAGVKNTMNKAAREILPLISSLDAFWGLPHEKMTN